MILLDTNIISEPWRPRPDPAVRAWLNAQPAQILYLCTPVLAELRYEIERLSESRRKDHLAGIFDRLETEGYRGRILTFDSSAAFEFGRLMANRERQGRRMETMDALIAAIAIAQGATLATCNIDDFTDLGLDLVNPFDAPID